MSGCLVLASGERQFSLFVNEAGHCDVVSPTRLEETSPRHFCFSASICVWVPFAWPSPVASVLVLDLFLVYDFRLYRCQSCLTTATTIQCLCYEWCITTCKLVTGLKVSHPLAYLCESVRGHYRQRKHHCDLFHFSLRCHRTSMLVCTCDNKRIVLWMYISRRWQCRDIYVVCFTRNFLFPCKNVEWFFFVGVGCSARRTWFWLGYYTCSLIILHMYVCGSVASCGLFGKIDNEAKISTCRVIFQLKDKINLKMVSRT